MRFVRKGVTNVAESFNDAVKRFTDELAELLISKRLDYGPGNLCEFGDFGVLVRVSDKFHRLKNLHKAGTEPANEAVTDTWQDIAGYAILALMMIQYGEDGYRQLEAIRPKGKAKFRVAEPVAEALPIETDYER